MVNPKFTYGKTSLITSDITFFLTAIILDFNIIGEIKDTYIATQ